MRNNKTLQKFFLLILLVLVLFLWPILMGLDKEKPTSIVETEITEETSMYDAYLIEDSLSLTQAYKDIDFIKGTTSIDFKNETLLTMTLEVNGVSSTLDVLKRYEVPFVSIEEMANVLQYTYGYTSNLDEILIKKDGESEILMALFKENRRDSLVEIKQKRTFQKEVALEGLPFKADSNAFMVPLENLLSFLGYQDITLNSDSIKATQNKENPSQLLFDYFIQNDKKIQENYFSNLDQTQTPSDLSFILLGDLSLGTSYGKKNGFDEIWEREGGAYFLEALQPSFNESDMVITNLENVFTKRDAHQQGKIYTYKAHRIEYLDVLTKGGITHVNVVNNHMVDFLQEGFDDTLNYLDEINIPYFGTNLKDSDNIELGSIKVDEYQVFEKDGIKIGLVGYLGFNSSFASDETIKEHVKILKEVEKVDYIVASIHWGGQETQVVTWKQKEMGKNLIDLGIDLVYGNHPHVLQEVEIYKGKPIYYSLGNFLFSAYTGARDPDSVMVKVTLTKEADGKLKESFSHTPILWSGHPSKNIYKPILTTDEFMVKRALDKLNLSTIEPISFNED